MLVCLWHVTWALLRFTTRFLSTRSLPPSSNCMPDNPVLHACVCDKPPITVTLSLTISLNLTTTVTLTLALAIALALTLTLTLNCTVRSLNSWQKAPSKLAGAASALSTRCKYGIITSH